jgi:hypothetical protein
VDQGHQDACQGHATHWDPLPLATSTTLVVPCHLEPKLWRRGI